MADVRMADLKAAQDALRRRQIAAKGMVSRARKDGSAEKIAAAVAREPHACAEFMAASDASIDEMFVINRAGLDLWTLTPGSSSHSRPHLAASVGPARFAAEVGVMRVGPTDVFPVAAGCALLLSRLR